MTRQGKSWTAAEDDHLLRYGAGKGAAAVLGRTVCAVHSRLEKLQRGMGPKQATPTTTRKCLRCRTPFESEGAHNFICPQCKTSSAWRLGNDFSMPRRA